MYDRAVRGVQLVDLGMPFACHIPESIGNRGCGKEFGPRILLVWMEKDVPYRAENEDVAHKLAWMVRRVFGGHFCYYVQMRL
jgi:hypothetical protein